jgi:hypothetical protein
MSAENAYRSPRRRRPLLVLAAASSTLALSATAAAQDADGYSVTKSQSVQNAPNGFVGRKTTDREQRVGNTEDTDGNSRTSLITIGGFAKKCPTADGHVEGSFEYLLTVEEVDTDEGETQRRQYSQHLTATLEGHVTDEAKLDYIDFNGQFTRRDRGTNIAPVDITKPLRTRFRVDEHGTADFSEMVRAVEKTAEIAFAMAMWQAAPTYKEAQVEWSRLNACVEFKFDPPSGGRSLGPNESAQVRAALRTKNEPQTEVSGAKTIIQTIDRVGSVAPRNGTTTAGEPLTLTYQASANPRPGNGIDISTLSRAGVAQGFWKIAELDTYELTLESTITSSLPSQAAQSRATGSVRLTGTTGVSRMDGRERRLHSGTGTVAFTTTPLQGRDPCDPLVQGSGTTQVTIPEAHIDIAVEHDLNGTATGGRAEIMLAYGIPFLIDGAETINEPFIDNFRCVLLPNRVEPFPFWAPLFQSGRAADGQIMFISKDGWTYVGQGDVVAKKTLRGNCGGECDEEVSVVTLKRVNASGAAGR